VSDSAVLPPPAPEAVHESLSTRTADVEQRVRTAFEATLGSKGSVPLALVSVGGFGRRELFPYSDVDLLLLSETDQNVPPREQIAAFLQGLWDSGLRPSHSVHSVADCAAEHAENVEFTISLLDRRWLAGDRGLFDQMDSKFRAFVAKRRAALAQKVATLAEGRRAKYLKSIYHLEPNVKESTGALRDLQTARWLQMIDPHEFMPDLGPAFDFLAAVRLRLHELAGRDQNALSFEAQEQLSEHPADLMREYYRHARTVDRACRQAIEACTEKPGTLLGRFHEWRSRLSTSEFTVARDKVILRGPHPPSDLSLFEFLARHDLHMASSTIDKLHGFVPHATWADWKRLLSLPKPSGGLRAMQEADVLSNALPEWRNIECLVVRDFYHRYTVDEHTLVAISSFESISDGRFSDLFAEIEDPALVRFALLMHDIGKGTGKDHEKVSLDITRGVLEKLGAPEADRETVEFLVLNHLILSTIMSSRDLYDGGTARMLADRIGTIERLKLLAMMTFADISAVNPQAMSPWRLEQLWRVYVLAHDELTRELETERIHMSSGDPTGMLSERAQFLEGLPTRYLRTHTAAEIDGHFQLSQQLHSRPVAVEIQHERGIYKLTLLCHDRPALFASVAGAISSFGLNILKAEAFSNAANVVVDTFTFADPLRTLELNPSEVDRLRGIVRKVVEGKQEVEKLLRSRPRPLPPSRRAQLKPRVAFKNDVSEAATLVEVVAEDRPGLLYELAHAISDAGCNIEVVMIDTEAHKALDVFYVTANGGKLDEPLQGQLKTNLLSACTGTH
jgi:[protein-PII] uridylyltransferase